MDTSAQCDTPLLLAARGPCPEIVNLLLKKGASPKSRDADGETALLLAINAASRSSEPKIREQELQTATILLNAGVDPNQGTQFFGTPLPSASRQGNLPMVRLLIERGAHVNTADTLGWTALHCAASNGDLEMVKILLGHGADLRAENSDKKSALALVKGPQAEGIKAELLKHGAH